MNESHQGYLNNLLSELGGLEVGLTQVAGLVKQAGETCNDEKREKYQRELTQLSLKRQDLIAKIKEESAELTEQQQSDLETAWLNVKDAVQDMLNSLIPKNDGTFVMIASNPVIITLSALGQPQKTEGYQYGE